MNLRGSHSHEPGAPRAETMIAHAPGAEAAAASADR
jgi:hypothetical protein